MYVLSKVNPEKISREEKKQSLSMITLIKDKRWGKIKGHECDDSRPQRQYIKMGYTASPKVSMEAFPSSIMMDAAENRDVAIIEILGEYLWFGITKDKTFLVKFEG